MSFSPNTFAGKTFFSLSRNRYKVWLISAFAVVISLIGFVISCFNQDLGLPLRPGLDFTGGTQIKIERQCIDKCEKISSLNVSETLNNIDFIEDKDLVKFIASHNGYEKEFSCIHKREISVNKVNGELIGKDEIIKKKNGRPINYSFRFHLYPGLTAVKTMGGNSVLVQISKNKSLIFTIIDESILLEKSIFLGRNKILDNTCITISGNLVNKDKTIRWEIKKNI